MVVDVTNLEPSQNINLNLNKSNQLSTIKSEFNKNLQKDSPDTQMNQSTQDRLNINYNVNFNLKVNLENKNFALTASNTLNQAANKLTLLREIAQQNLLPEIQNDQKYMNQYKFEQLKNDFNKFIENAFYKSHNILQKLSNEGIMIRNNDNTKETIKLNIFEVDGFNKNNFKIEDLNVNDDENAKRTINDLQQAEDYFKKEEERFNSANNRLSEDLLNLLKENITNTDIQSDSNNTNEIKDITDLMLKNPNEFYNSQANLIQNSYLELLQEI